MKKSYIILLALCFSVFSCSLEDKSYTKIDKNTYMNDASEAESVLQGVYSYMIKGGMYGYYFSLYFTLPTDEAKVEGSSLNNFRNVPCNAYTATEDEIENGWKQMYAAIYAANDFLERIGKKSASYSDSDKSKANVYVAEARALRALFYFELVRWFGHVPLMTSTAQSLADPSTFVQAEPEKVYEFIEEDLKFAVDNLPYATQDTVRTSNSWRMSKGAALGLLTKVYATWAGAPLYGGKEKWELARDTATQLIASSQHSLLPDFAQLWKNAANNLWDPSESLIEVSFYSPTITNVTGFDSSGRIGKWNGVSATVNSIRCYKAAGNWKVVPMFGQNWKDNDKDLRWDISIADYKYTADGKVPIQKNISYKEVLTDKYDASSTQRKYFCSALSPAKWDTEVYVNQGNELVHTDLSNVNWYVLRYADVLLLYAEAVNEVDGPTADAYEMVNQVRRRGYGRSIGDPDSEVDLPTGMSQEEFRQAVRDERAHELAFEGHRRQDLTRWGIYCQTVKQTYIDYSGWYEDGPTYYPAGLYTKEGKNELLPIPQHEMDLCKQFQQNDGWK